jgi:hypothetical protein
MCGKKSALVLYPLTKLTGLLRKHISEHVSRIHYVFLLVVYVTVAHIAMALLSVAPVPLTFL